jgi:hypothetical protein
VTARGATRPLGRLLRTKKSNAQQQPGRINQKLADFKAGPTAQIGRELRIGTIPGPG